MFRKAEFWLVQMLALVCLSILRADLPSGGISNWRIKNVYYYLQKVAEKLGDQEVAKCCQFIADHSGGSKAAQPRNVTLPGDTSHPIGQAASGGVVSDVR